ncbi:hypothetical protein KR018_002870 [Drosophila ironensis]|nr:hypothetical protein KR018_002870 [Drosophila ironensis]
MHSSGKQLVLHFLFLFMASSHEALSPHDSDANPSSGLILSRSKRVIIFDGAGTVKMVGGLAYPIKEADPVESVWGFINYQAQYVPSPVPIYWWSYWNTSTFVSTAREGRKDVQQQLRQDETRLWLYDIIETGLERFGGHHGSVCLLRSICEMSQNPFEHSNIFSELLNAVLIPTLDNVPGKYLHARDAGKAGANCWKTFDDCSQKLWLRIIKMTKIAI